MGTVGQRSRRLGPVDSPVYGCKSDRRNVREAVLKHIVDGRMDVVVHNKALGIDPCRDTSKELVVNYRIGEAR